MLIFCLSVLDFADEQATLQLASDEAPSEDTLGCFRRRRRGRSPASDGALSLALFSSCTSEGTLGGFFRRRRRGRSPASEQAELYTVFVGDGALSGSSLEDVDLSSYFASAGCGHSGTIDSSPSDLLSLKVAKAADPTSSPDSETRFLELVWAFSPFLNPSGDGAGSSAATGTIVWVLVGCSPLLSVRLGDALGETSRASRADKVLTRLCPAAAAPAAAVVVVAAATAAAAAAAVAVLAATEASPLELVRAFSGLFEMPFSNPSGGGAGSSAATGTIVWVLPGCSPLLSVRLGDALGETSRASSMLVARGWSRQQQQKRPGMKSEQM